MHWAVLRAKWPAHAELQGHLLSSPPSCEVLAEL